MEWGIGRAIISTKCREVCLPASSHCVQSLELFIRPLLAECRRGLEGHHGMALFHLSLCCPNIEHDHVISLQAFHPWVPPNGWLVPRPHHCCRTEVPRNPPPSIDPSKPPTAPLTGWGGCAVATDWKLVLESGQGAWWGESAQHRREEEGVGGHRVPIEVPSPRCWAGAAVAGHAKQPQGRAGRQSGKRLRRASGCPSSGHGA